MKSRHALTLTHCPYCGARIVQTPREMKQWRKTADLNQRQMAARLKISAAHVAYLENGKRSPSASLIETVSEIYSRLKKNGRIRTPPRLPTGKGNNRRLVSNRVVIVYIC